MSANLIFDGGDINDNGQWRGEEVSCLDCRETRPMQMGPSPAWCVAELRCGECGRGLAEFGI